MLEVRLDVAFGPDVSASEAIRILGRVGDEKVLLAYAADRWTEAARTTDRQGNRPEARPRSGVYCHICGAYLERQDTNYCPYCGARITA